jgi:hypothetical protein
MQESIFIATPTHFCKNYCQKEFLEAVLETAVKPYDATIFVLNNSEESSYGTFFLENYNNRNIHYIETNFHKSNREFFFGNRLAIHRRITETAKLSRKIFLDDCNYGDWYLSLESDVILNKDSFDKIIKNICEKAALILHTNCYCGFNSSKERCFTQSITMGCTLIHRSVLEKINFRHDESLPEAHYDAFFAHDCVSNGIPMIYDPEIHFEHRHEKTGRGWDKIPSNER